MPFVSNLQAASSTPSGVANPLGSSAMPTGDILDIYNNIKDREMRDFQNKASFMADLSLKQERLRKMYDNMDSTYGMGPQITDTQKTATNPSGQPQNTVMAADPNALTGYQKADLALKQQGQNIESQRVAQTGQLGQQKLDIQSAQEKLNQQKSDQVYETKQADLQRKYDEAATKAKESDAKLKQNETDLDKRLAAAKEHEKNMADLHKAQMDLQQSKYDKAVSDHKDAMNKMQQRLDQQKNTQTVKRDAQGNIISTTDTSRGGKTLMYGPDGSQHMIANEKIQDAKDNYQMTTEPPKQQEQNNNDNQNDEEE